MGYALILYYALLNSIAFGLMKRDKRRAVERRYRIAERTFYTIAWCGGGLGIGYGARRFRHKTTRFTFTVVAPALFFVHLVGWLFIWIGGRVDWN